MAVKVEDGPYDFVINEVKEVKGESMASNRKNRIITWWDYTIEIKFEVNNKKRKSSVEN
jgi:activator of HSP90 ATPase